MVEQKECDTCGGLVKHIPAGTSKRTGKPYNDFWACQNDNCPSRQKSTQTPQTTTTTQPEASNGKQNAAVEMIYELQAIRKLLEDIKEQVVAANTFFRTEQNDKPSVESEDSDDEPPKYGGFNQPGKPSL